jgi:transcriptional regulator with XRE-family HTH domain
MQKFSNFIKSFRHNNNLTQYELAKLFGITQQAIAKYESGKFNRPSPDVALKIEQATGGAVTRDELLFPELYSQPPPTGQDRAA